MKVAFIGTHGVGKTTLCYDLAAGLKKRDLSVELVREVARECPLPINRETTVKAQAWILHTQIAWELQAEAKADVVCCDRAVLDNYCYLVNKFGRQPQLESWLAWWMETYSILIGVPTLADGIIPDGFRSEDRAFQQRIEMILNELLSTEPFERIRPNVKWLEARDRRVWGERIFATALPHLDGVHAAQKSAAG
jgi:thymidylate kinase